MKLFLSFLLLVSFSFSQECINYYKKLDNLSKREFISLWKLKEAEKYFISESLIEDWYIYEIEIPSYSIKTWFSNLLNNSDIKYFHLLRHCNRELNTIILKDYPLFIKYFYKPTEAEQLIAINKNISSLIYISNPTEKVQLKAVKKYLKAADYIKKIHPNVLKYLKKHKFKSATN